MTKKNSTDFTPSQEVLKKYAKVLVRFALGSGKGIKKGDVVYLVGSEVTKPLFLAVRNEILQAGGHVIGNFIPDNTPDLNFGKEFYDNANKSQLEFFPEKYMKGLIDTIDHSVYIIADVNKEALKDVDPKKIMLSGKAKKPYLDWRQKKEAQGKFSWTLCLYGTKESAAVVGLSPKQYWNEIIKACYLDEKDPVKKWKELYKDLEKHRRALNTITQKTEKFHIFGKDADLWITPGESRQWLCGRGANIPSFEIFTSPDWRGTEGWIYFNHPLYRYGNIMEGIKLTFKKGKVIKSSAKKGEKVIKQMIATPGADKIGEFSLTDKRFSRITKPMGETLFDENMGGPEGNTHLALGFAFREAFSGDVSKLTEKKAATLGLNDSSVHTDIISTTKRTVTAHLKDGSEVVIYKDGMFTI